MPSCYALLTNAALEHAPHISRRHGSGRDFPIVEQVAEQWAVRVILDPHNRQILIDIRFEPRIYRLKPLDPVRHQPNPPSVAQPVIIPNLHRDNTLDRRACVGQEEGDNSPIAQPGGEGPDADTVHQSLEIHHPLLSKLEKNLITQDRDQMSLEFSLKMRVNVVSSTAACWPRLRYLLSTRRANAIAAASDLQNGIGRGRLPNRMCRSSGGMQIKDGVPLQDR